MIDIKSVLEKDAALVEERMRELLSSDDADILPIIDAASYSLFAGGKRKFTKGG